MDNYRIKRIDSRNIAIQRKIVTQDGRDEWANISYHGNSLFSLVSGLSELIMRESTPQDGKLLETLETLRLEHVSGLERIEKMIKESDCGKILEKGN
jgi:hypothetical protein